MIYLTDMTDEEEKSPLSKLSREKRRLLERSVDYFEDILFASGTAFYASPFIHLATNGALNNPDHFNKELLMYATLGGIVGIIGFSFRVSTGVVRMAVKYSKRKEFLIAN